jgi:hypothetical protein
MRGVSERTSPDDERNFVALAGSRNPSGFATWRRPLPISSERLMAGLSYIWQNRSIIALNEFARSANDFVQERHKPCLGLAEQVFFDL